MEYPNFAISDRFRGADTGAVRPGDGNPGPAPSAAGSGAPTSAAGNVSPIGPFPNGSFQLPGAPELPPLLSAEPGARTFATGRGSRHAESAFDAKSALRIKELATNAITSGRPEMKAITPVNQIPTECRAFADEKPRADRYAGVPVDGRHRTWFVITVNPSAMRGNTVKDCKPLLSSAPAHSILNAQAFHYTNSAETDIRKTFARVLRSRAKANAPINARATVRTTARFLSCELRLRCPAGEGQRSRDPLLQPRAYRTNERRRNLETVCVDAIPNETPRRPTRRSRFRTCQRRWARTGEWKRSHDRSRECAADAANSMRAATCIQPGRQRSCAPSIRSRRPRTRAQG